jgi:hypothetical protein
MKVSIDKVERVVKQASKGTVLADGGVEINTYMGASGEEIIQLYYREPEYPIVFGWLDDGDSVSAKYGAEITVGPSQQDPGNLLDNVVRIVKEINTEYLKESGLIHFYNGRPFRVFIDYSNEWSQDAMVGVVCPSCRTSITEEPEKIPHEYVDIFMMYIIASCYSSCDCSDDEIQEFLSVSDTPPRPVNEGEKFPRIKPR